MPAAVTKIEILNALGGQTLSFDETEANGLFGGADSFDIQIGAVVTKQISFDSSNLATSASNMQAALQNAGFAGATVALQSVSTAVIAKGSTDVLPIFNVLFSAQEPAIQVINIATPSRNISLTASTSVSTAAANTGTFSVAAGGLNISEALQIDSSVTKAAFAGAVTAASVNVATPLTLGGGTVTTGGGQTYSNPVVLTANTRLLDTGGGNIVFGSTVGGAFALNVTTTGATEFDGLVGAGANTLVNLNVVTGTLTAMQAIHATAAGFITLTSTATETIAAPVTLLGTGTGAITLKSTGGSLMVNALVSSAAGPINATAAAAIVESAKGAFGTTGLLTTNSKTGQTLTGPNTVASFNRGEYDERQLSA